MSDELRRSRRKTSPLSGGDPLERLSAEQTQSLTGISRTRLHHYASLRERGEDVEPGVSPPHFSPGAGRRFWLRQDVESWLLDHRYGG